MARTKDLRLFFLMPIALLKSLPRRTGQVICLIK
ncbi:hypothetical protein V6Z11_A03G016500 [Gossypium hirsutum]